MAKDLFSVIGMNPFAAFGDVDSEDFGGQDGDIDEAVGDIDRRHQPYDTKKGKQYPERGRFVPIDEVRGPRLRS